MARNLDEPGANFNQLLELSLRLENARTFAGTKVADASTEMEQSPDSFLRSGETLEDWDTTFRKPNAAGGRVGFNKGGSFQDILRNYWQGIGPWGQGSTGAFYTSDLYDALAPYLGMFNKGGRVYGKYAQQLASGGRAGVLRDGLFGGGPPGVHGRETGGGYSDRERHERRQPVKGPPGGGDPGMTYTAPPSEEAAFEAMWKGAPPSMREREKMFRKHRTAKLLEEKRISDFDKKIAEREKLYPYTDMTEEEFSKKHSKVYDFMKKDPAWDWKTFQKVSFANPEETFQATGGRELKLPIGETDLKNIDLFLTPFGETNYEMSSAGPHNKTRIMSDQDKAAVALHEMRHKKILNYPPLVEAQPPNVVYSTNLWDNVGTFPGRNPPLTMSHMKKPLVYRQQTPPGSRTKFSSPMDMHELFIRFMDRRYGPNFEPRDYTPYFDKIWRDEWEPYAEEYENILTDPYLDLSPVNLAGGGRVPLNKGTTPYNAETFKEKSDLYLQAILGTSDKDFYRSKLQNEYEKAMKEGALSAKEATEWVRERAKLYSTLINESKRQERTLSQELRGIGSFSLPTPYGVEPDINKYYEDKKAMGGRVGLAEGDTPSQAWMRNNFFKSGYDDKGVITLYEYMNGPIGWSDYMSYGPGAS